MHFEQSVPGAVNGTRLNLKSVSRSFGVEVPRKAMISSFASTSSNRVAWVSVALSLEYCTTELPDGGVVQESA